MISSRFFFGAGNSHLRNFATSSGVRAAAAAAAANAATSTPGAKAKDWRTTIGKGDAAPRILITGALGQLGSGLAKQLRSTLGADNVVTSDVRQPPRKDKALKDGPFLYCDVLDYRRLEEIVVDHRIDWVIHLSALLSAVGEQNVQKALSINNIGFQNVLELSRIHNLRLFCPSTIGAFGPTTPLENTPDLTIMRPTTIYGVTKVNMELMGEYYSTKYGLDFRSLRLPGVLCPFTPPGGGTTDYSVEMLIHAARRPAEVYTSFLGPDSRLPMIHIDDCVRGIITFMAADKGQLTQKVYNLGAISFTPAELADEVRKTVPGFKVQYKPDFRQAIADNWPRRLDDSKARKDWGWYHDYDTPALVHNMLTNVANGSMH